MLEKAELFADEIRVGVDLLDTLRLEDGMGCRNFTWMTSSEASGTCSCVHFRDFLYRFPLVIF